MPPPKGACWFEVSPVPHTSLCSGEGVALTNTGSYDLVGQCWVFQQPTTLAQSQLRAAVLGTQTAACVGAVCQLQKRWEGEFLKPATPRIPWDHSPSGGPGLPPKKLPAVCLEEKLKVCG